MDNSSVRVGSSSTTSTRTAEPSARRSMERDAVVFPPFCAGAVRYPVFVIDMYLILAESPETRLSPSCAPAVELGQLFQRTVAVVMPRRDGQYGPGAPSPAQNGPGWVGPPDPEAGPTNYDQCQAGLASAAEQVAA